MRSLFQSFSRIPRARIALLSAAGEAPSNYQLADLTPEERHTTNLFEKATSSVVFVTNLATRRTFLRTTEEVAQGTGSGFVWDHLGHVVTNFHVVQGAANVVITLADQREVDATVVGVDAARDLAVLRITVPEGSEVKPIPKGKSKSLLVGQKVQPR